MRSFRHLVAVAALSGSLALATGPASAQGSTTITPPASGGFSIPIDTYNPRQLPVVQSPTNKVKNVVGRYVEKACLRSGKTALVCATAAVAAGGVGLARVLDNSWQEIADTVGTGALTGAAVSATAGCAYGGALGALAGGVGAIPGCVAGAIEGAITGAFFGGAVGAIGLTKDDSVKIEQGTPAQQTISGSGVRQSTTTAGVNQATVTINATTPDPLQAQKLATSGYATLQTFPCNFSNSLTTFYACSIVPMQTTREIPATANPDNIDSLLSPGGEVSPGGSRGVLGFNPQSMRVTGGNSRYQSSNTPNATAEAYLGCTYAAKTCHYKVSQASVPGAAGVVFLSLFRSTVSYTTAASVPVVQYLPVVKAPVWASAFGNQLSPEVLAKQLNDNLAAAIANAAWKGAGSDAGAGAYDPASGAAVTGQDVAASNAAQPENQLQVQDLMRPIADLNAGGGTAANPVPEPVRTVNTNPYAGSSTSPSGGTGGQTQTGTKDNPAVTQEKADQDLESQLGGTVGNPIQPVIDFISGPLAPFMSPTFDVPHGTCPVWRVDMREWFSFFLNTDINGSSVSQGPAQAKAAEFLQWDSSGMCDFFDDHYATVQLMAGILLAFMAVYWFFE